MKKCSLRGLESRDDMRFFTYPKASVPDTSNYLLLDLEGEELSRADADKGLFLVDGTWQYAAKMVNALPKMEKRRLPNHFLTAYPRKQTGCSDPERGLASVEALYIAYKILGWDANNLLDHYYWKDLFLEKNRGRLNV